MLLVKRLLIVVFLVNLVGCATTPGYIRGNVNAQVFSEAPDPRVFTVVLPESSTLRDRNIASLISAQLVSNGYESESDTKIANTAVMFKFEIGQGKTHVSSSTNSSTGKTNVSSSTTYPRFFQLSIYDLDEFKRTKKPVLIWQGEVHSRGGGTNKAKLAKPFLEELFKYFENNVQEKSFMKMGMW